MQLSLPGQTQLYRKLQFLESAGISSGLAMEHVLTGEQTSFYKKKLSKVAQALWRGDKVSDALREAQIVPKLHCAVLALGEKSGRLDVVYMHLATMAETDHSLRLKIRSELWTTKLTMMVALPFVVGLLRRGHLDPASLIAILLLLTGYVFILAGEYMVTRLSGYSNVHIDKAVLKLPILGRIAYDMAQSRFARSFGCLYAAGVEAAPALRTSADACGSESLRQHILTAIPHIEQGETIVNALAATKVFSNVVLTMLKTGEMTGSIDALMTWVATTYEGDIALRMHKFCVTTGAIAILIVGALVGIICFYNPGR